MEALKELILTETKEMPVKINRVGGGFYADVYKVDYKNLNPIIVKVYKPKGMMEKEKAQIKLLSQYALYTMPSVLWSHSADEKYEKDVLAMNYLQGENGGNAFYINPSKKAKLAEQVVDNLLAFHNVHNSDGFGEINADKYCKTFNEYYREKADSILKMTEKLNGDGQITDFVLSVVKEGLKEFDKIFYLPITEASLIHGDYNMWNVMIDKKNCNVTAIIDPCGCMWADSEYDLYQLNNANGKHLKLFDTYAKKKTLSENCFEKMAFYELFTEIEHYYNSGYPVIQKLIKKQAINLKRYL